MTIKNIPKLKIYSFAAVIFFLVSCAKNSSPPRSSSPVASSIISPALTSENIQKTTIVSIKVLDEKSNFASGGSRDNNTSGYGRGKQQHSQLFDMIEDVFTQEIIGKGYRYASRSELQPVLNELKLQDSGLTDADAATIGKILNVPAVLILNVTKLGIVGKNNSSLITMPFELAALLIVPTKSTVCCSMTARFISTETSEVLWIGKVTDVCVKQDYGTDFHSVVNQAASILAKSIPPAPSRAIPRALPLPLPNAIPSHIPLRKF